MESEAVKVRLQHWLALDLEIVAYEIVVVAFAFVVVVAVVAWSLYVLVLASWDLA